MDTEDRIEKAIKDDVIAGILSGATALTGRGPSSNVNLFINPA